MMLITVNEDLEPCSKSVRVGERVDTVGQPGPNSRVLTFCCLHVAQHTYVASTICCLILLYLTVQGTLERLPVSKLTIRPFFCACTSEQYLRYACLPILSPENNNMHFKRNMHFTRRRMMLTCRRRYWRAWLFVPQSHQRQAVKKPRSARVKQTPQLQPPPLPQALQQPQQPPENKCEDLIAVGVLGERRQGLYNDVCSCIKCMKQEQTTLMWSDTCKCTRHEHNPTRKYCVKM